MVILSMRRMLLSNDYVLPIEVNQAAAGSYIRDARRDCHNTEFAAFDPDPARGSPYLALSDQRNLVSIWRR